MMAVDAIRKVDAMKRNMEDMPASRRRVWTRPVQIGIGFGIAGLLLTVIGILRGAVPLQPGSILMALLIGGGVWFVVSWAVATAAFDVEADLAEKADEVVELET
jgi:hypothetical protein